MFFIHYAKPTPEMVYYIILLLLLLKKDLLFIHYVPLKEIVISEMLVEKYLGINIF